MDRTTRAWIIRVGLLIGLLSAWFLLLFKPTQSEISRLQTKKKEILGTMGREIPDREIKALRDRLDTLRHQYAEKQSHFIAGTALSFLVDFLERMGEESGLKLKLLTPDYNQLKELAESQEGVKAFSLKVQYLGHFEPFTRFIDRMETFPYYFRLDGYEIGLAEEGKPELTFTLDAKLFLKETGEAAAKETLRAGTPKQG